MKRYEGSLNACYIVEEDNLKRHICMIQYYIVFWKSQDYGNGKR
jgi:hypothetical protein